MRIFCHIGRSGIQAAHALRALSSRDESVQPQLPWLGNSR